MPAGSALLRTDGGATDLERRRKIAIYCGLAAPIVSFLSILVATMLDPGFAWVDSALSDTGALPEGSTVSLSLLAEKPSFFVFNGGLLLTGTVGLPFAWLLFHDGRTPIHYFGAGVFALALVTLAAVGWYHLPREPHGVAALGHFLTSTLALVIYGLGSVVAGRRRFGAITIVAGLVAGGFWFVWGLWLASGPIPGIAVPELVGALAFGGWSFWVAFRKHTGVDSAPGDSRDQRHSSL